MGLLREWAERAHAQGRRGRLIEQIMVDGQFERHSLAWMQQQADRTALLQEATSTDFPDIVGAQASVQRALMDRAMAEPPSYRKYARIASLADMKQVKRLRRSDSDRYTAVPEGGEALQGAFSSHTAVYTPSKYELALEFTWEMLINDDLGAFRTIGTDLAQGAINTVSDFVVDMLTSTADIYDGDALFDAAAHGNKGTAALDATSLAAGITAMRSQTSERGNPLHIVPGFLIVPPELEFAAKTLVHSSLVPGSDHNDANVLNGIVEVIVEPLLTDANNWYLIADPASVPTLELGFLNGRETPEILVKEDFERDVLCYKGRLVLGGAVLDYRGFYGGITCLSTPSGCIT
ncbi:MAG: Mu-like prophage major head subunit gpT family protein, partial [bacterium]